MKTKQRKKRRRKRKLQVCLASSWFIILPAKRWQNEDIITSTPQHSHTTPHKTTFPIAKLWARVCVRLCSFHTLFSLTDRQRALWWLYCRSTFVVSSHMSELKWVEFDCFQRVEFLTSLWRLFFLLLLLLCICGSLYKHIRVNVCACVWFHTLPTTLPHI